MLRIQVPGLQYTRVITFKSLWFWPSQHFNYSHLQQEPTRCQREAATSSSFHQLIRDNSLDFCTYFSLFLPLLCPCKLHPFAFSVLNRRVLSPGFRPAAWLRVGEQLLPRWAARESCNAPSASRSLLGRLAAHGASPPLLTVYRLSTVPVMGWHQSSWVSCSCYFPGCMWGSELLLVIIKGMISN